MKIIYMILWWILTAVIACLCTYAIASIYTQNIATAAGFSVGIVIGMLSKTLADEVFGR